MARWAITGCLAVIASGSAVAQKYVPPPPPLAVDPCAAVVNPLLPKDPAAVKAQPVCPSPAVPATPATPPQGKTAADQFPFPVEPATGAKPSAAQQFPFPQSESPKAPAPVVPGGAASQFPYPGETAKSPDAIPDTDTKRYVPDVPANSGESDNVNSSSSSSSSGGVASPVDDPIPGSPEDTDNGRTPGRAQGRRHLPKVSAQTAEDRVSEDLDVAKFYSDRGNFQAAYLRAKDAAKLMPEDAETHFALAQAAEKLQRRDEAVAEYALYLKLDPSGQKTAVAQRALAQLR